MGYREMNSNTDPTTPLGEILRRGRAKADKSQQEVADEIGISQSIWARWEKGEHLPALWRFGPIAQALGLTIGELREAAEKTSVQIHKQKLAGTHARPQSRIEQMEAQMLAMQEELEALRKQAAPKTGGKPAARAAGPARPVPRSRKRA